MAVADMNVDNWASQRAAYKQRLSTIVVPLDITPGVAKGILSRIDAFFSEVRIELGELEGQKERVDSIIREWERSKAIGSSDTQRKKNATDAIQEYPLTEDQTVNLYEVQRDLAQKHAFMSALIDTLYGKQARLITITGVMKLEKELLPFANIGMDAGQ